MNKAHASSNVILRMVTGLRIYTLRGRSNICTANLLNVYNGQKMSVMTQIFSILSSFQSIVFCSKITQLHKSPINRI